MKKYDRISAGIIIGYLCMVLLLLVYLKKQPTQQGRQYLVEINEIMTTVEAGEAVDWSAMQCIKQVDYLSIEDTADTDAVAAFYRKQNGVDSRVEPLVLDGNLQGYMRFDYTQTHASGRNLPLLVCCFLLPGFVLAFVLFYVRSQILKPFHTLSEMPYELSRGHLTGEIEESRNRYFGRFTWGISMLRDELKKTKAHELALEKEKKLLLLSISHDIKTPLGTIRLYAKAIEEGIYDTPQKRAEAAHGIQVHAGEIETFVKEIVKSASEDILSIEVKNGEFYLRDLMEKVRGYYAPKCSLKLIDFAIAPYENKLLRGDMDRAFEVIENLIENAFKYGDGKAISISFSQEEYCQLITVTNTGKSVEEQEMPHLFDSFYRGSNVGSADGNGLGLYICRQIMRKMEGDIFAEQKECGMAFTLVFRE